jgi:hypothetical protein
LRDHDLFGTAESWAGFEDFGINGYISYSKGRSKTAKFGRNQGGLVIYIREGINDMVTEISTNTKELSVTKKRNLQAEKCMGYVYNAPQNIRNLSNSMEQSPS